LLLRSLLEEAGLPLAETCLLRHAHRGRPYALWQKDRASFKRYQEMQLRDGLRTKTLDRHPYWVAFTSVPAGGTKFLGVYEAVNPQLNAEPRPMEVDDSFAAPGTHLVFQTRPLGYLSELSERLTIRWDGGPQNWVQKAQGNTARVISLSDSAVDTALLSDMAIAPAFTPWQPRQTTFATAFRSIDVISMCDRQEQRSRAHEKLLANVVEAAKGHTTKSSLLVDLLVNERILIEIKSLEDDALIQVRAALAQLYHYRFVYRHDLRSPDMLAVFGKPPIVRGDDLSLFLDECDIGVAWATDRGFDGTPRARAIAPWLFRP
jgi:hypothetical protein